ncbi:FAD-binding oxidoreductase [Sneathiella sp. CAU 1612]|uniref:FAD-binding oxidoreductase n=1 Tax=Sneathiella sedimenti TaxID=2816034 RepID=A0ABS3F744_9PROT|nr:FAD-binding oxidoreductase [Sneathiella sedimenti]MBO0334341.1 FAD-binding oxidoreductase [Sneathiella sedimenti]
MKTDPFWWESAKPEPTDMALPESVSDVLIIGGGYTGLSAALTLTKRGQTVTVLDAEMPGYGASGRNGGMIGNLLKPGLSGLIEAYGVERGCAIYKEALASVKFIAARIEEEGIDCDLALNGRFYPAVLEKHYRAMSDDFAVRQKYLDIPEEMVGPEDYAEDVDSPGYKGGLRQHHTGGLHPAKYVKGLTQAALRSGARIIAPLRAEGIIKRPTGFAVQTARGDLNARALLIATNGYGGGLYPFLQKRIFPVGSTMIATEELSENLVASLFPTKRMITDTRKMLSYYRPSPDGRRVLLGARPSIFPATPEVQARSLKKTLDSIFPALRQAAVSHVWTGNVAYNFAAMPTIGEHEGVYYAMGYCGSGVAISGYFGHKAALKILGDPEGETAFDGLPLEDRFYYNGRPWFLPVAMMGYRIRDYFGF